MGWFLSLHTLCDEVSKGLRLDRYPRDITDVEFIEFEGPFHDASEHIMILDDFSKWRCGYYRHRVSVEVVDWLPLGDKHCVQQFLDLWVPRLGLGRHLTDEVGMSLHLEYMTHTFPFHHQRRVDHLGGGCHVEEEGLAWIGCDQNWW